MIFEFLADQILPLAAALFVAGGITGVLAGLFGVGGGAIIVPILYQVFVTLHVPEEVCMPLTIGTSLAIIIPTSIRSFLAHRAKGAVDMAMLKAWALPCVIGVIVGSVLAAFAAPWVFKIVFVVIAGGNAIALLIGRTNWKITNSLPGTLWLRFIGFVIGIFSSLMGISGGMLSNIVLMMFSRTIHQAVATSAGLGVLISIPGTIGYVFAGLPKMNLLPPFSLGFISLLGFVLLAPLSMLLAPIGAKLAHAVSRRKLEIAYGFYLLVAAGRFVVNLL